MNPFFQVDSNRVCALLTKVLEEFHDEQDKLHGNSQLDDTDDGKYTYSPPRPRTTPEELTDDSSPPLSMVAPRTKSPPEDYQ